VKSIGDQYRRPRAPLNVGIVGGSIAGCLMALELLGAGHRVTVFERSRGEMQGLLGAGLGTPTPMFRTLVERGLVGADLPHLALDEMAFVGQAAGGERLGHVALTLPLIFISFHWGDLHRGLRSRVPDDAYRAGQGVSGVSSLDGGAVIRLDDHSEHRFDVVVCAEGYHSQSRTALFGSEPEYRGYICWRGVLDEREMDAGELMRSTFARFGCRGMPGSFLYPVPGADGSIVRGERLVNWGCYVPVAAEKLADFLVDSSGQRHDGTIPPGRLRPEQEHDFRTLARESLPPYYADNRQRQRRHLRASRVLGGRTRLPRRAHLPGRRRRRGGAAVHGKRDLQGRHQCHQPRRGAGRARGPRRSTRTLGRFGGRDGRTHPRSGTAVRPGLIQGTPDFGAMDTTTAADWWTDSITHPEGFTFEARGFATDR